MSYFETEDCFSKWGKVVGIMRTSPMHYEKTLTQNCVFCSFPEQLPRRPLSSTKGRNAILTIEKRLVRRRRWNWDGAPMTASSPPTMPCCSAKIFLQSFCKSFCFAHHQVFTCRTKLVMSNCQKDKAVRETHIKKEKQLQRYELQSERRSYYLNSPWVVSNHKCLVGHFP